MKPKIVAEISAEDLHTLLISQVDKIAAHHRKDERDITFDDILEYLESRRGLKFLVREWK